MECPNCGRHILAFTKTCPTCGKAIPPLQYLLEESGVLPPSAPAAGSRSDGDLVGRPTARLASLGDRFVASVIDAVALLAIFAVVDLWAFLRWSTAGPAEWNLTTASLLMAAACNAGVFFLYYWLLEASFGATFGKLMVGLRVVPTGYNNMLPAAAVRNLLRPVDAIGFYLLGILVASCTTMRQRLGDLVARTAVIELQVGRWWKFATVICWTAILAGCGWALPKVCARPFAAQPPRYFGQVSLQLGRTRHSAYMQFQRLRVDIHLAPAAQDVVAERALAVTKSGD